MELLYMSSDLLHDALVDWVSKGEDTGSFLISLMTKMDKEDVSKAISMVLRVDPGWLEENSTPEEAFTALATAVKLNDWNDMLQTMMMLDTLRLEEVSRLWQMVKVDSLRK